MQTNKSDKIILTGTIGSHSYGTATPTSDYDYMSVVVAGPEHYLGLRNWGNSGTKDDVYEDPVKGLVEHKYFEVKKAVGMFTNFNPNIIPLLWLDPKHYEMMSPEGAMLVQNRTIFNSKKVYHTFSGYAHGQLQKMGGVFNDEEEPNKLLKAGYERFQKWADMAIDEQRQFRDHPDSFIGPDGQGSKLYDEGYLNALIALRTHSKEECKRIKDGPITGRMGKKRKELREKYGYDTKFAFHTIRLMRMCNEFLAHPEEGLKVYRKDIDGDFLYTIREGAFTQEQVKEMADELFAQARNLIGKADLPEDPDTVSIENLTMDIIRLSLFPTKVVCAIE